MTDKKTKVAEAPTEIVKKKRQSGKRKPKPKTEEVKEEGVSLQKLTEEEIAGVWAEKLSKTIDADMVKGLLECNGIIDGVPQEEEVVLEKKEKAEALKDLINKIGVETDNEHKLYIDPNDNVIFMKPKPPELSKQAQGWVKWLEYQKMTPEEFIKKYPSNKMKHFIEEIIRFKEQN